jgi:hypothetical protein
MSKIKLKKLKYFRAKTFCYSTIIDQNLNIIMVGVVVA